MNNQQIMNHTPGPWVSFENTDGHTIQGQNKEHVAYCDYTSDTEETPAKSNARLIAAAPEMLAALKALTEHSSGTNTAFFVKGTSKAMHAAMQGQKALLDAARAAIAKATS